MALGQYVGNHAASGRKLPTTGGAKKKVPPKTKVKAKRRLSGKELAEAKAQADPYRFADWFSSEEPAFKY